MTDFSALGFDPAPGDLSVVERYADDLTTGYESVEDALLLLDTDDDSAWVGQAAVAFRAALSEDFRPHLLDTSEALRISSRALNTWASQLSGYQLRARQLAEEASTAQSLIASRSAAHASALANADEEDADPRAVANAARALSSAQAELDAVRAAAGRLKDEVDSAAAVTAGALLSSGAILNVYAGNAFTNFLSDIGHGLADFGNWLMDNLVPILEDILRAVLPIISILALCLPFIPVLGTIAFAISVALVVIDFLQAATGRGSWQDFFVGAGSLVIGLGVGKLATTLFPKGSEVLLPSFQNMTPALAGGGTAAGAGTIAIAINVNFHALVSNSYWTVNTAKNAYDKGTGFLDAVAQPWQNLAERVQNTVQGNGPRTNEELHG